MVYLRRSSLHHLTFHDLYLINDDLMNSINFRHPSKLLVILCHNQSVITFSNNKIGSQIRADNCTYIYLSSFHTMIYNLHGYMIHSRSRCNKINLLKEGIFNLGTHVITLLWVWLNRALILQVIHLLPAWIAFVATRLSHKNFFPRP